MSTFVLVHGAWSNADAWHLVADRLRAIGHDVVSPELPAHGADATAPASVTLDDYITTVTDAIHAAGAPAVLVGHSMAGTVISSVAERSPDLVDRLVYVAAFLLPSGQSLYGFTQSSPGMADSLLGPALRPGDGVLGVDPAQFVDVFCHDAPTGLAASALASLRPDPLAPLGTPIEVTAERWGARHRTYIHTTADRCVSPASQAEMVAAVGAHTVRSIDAGHLAMLSQPDALAALIAAS